MILYLEQPENYEKVICIKEERPKVYSSGQSLYIQFSKANAVLFSDIGILVKRTSETDVSEQSQSVTNVANGELFHE